MNTAFLLTLLLGILWSIVGAVVSVARRQNCPIWSFYACGALSAAVLLTVCGLFHPGELAAGGVRVTGFLALGALLNALGQALTMYNLRGGARALLFAIPQMNFVAVYVFSVLFLHEKNTFSSVAGILLLCFAILGISVLGKRGIDSTLPNRRQLLLCIAAAVIVGCGQCALLLAGRCGNGLISAGTKSVGVLFFSALFYGTGIIGERRKTVLQRKMILQYGCTWGLFAAFSYLTLFHAIDAMNRLGRGGLVFAIGCSTAIAVFWCFSIVKMHDRFSWKQAFLMAAIILGVILLQCGR